MPAPLANRRFIFLDTQVYIANNFCYSNRNFSRLVSLVQEERISLISTTITYQEIKSNIHKAVVDCDISIRNFKKNARILRNSRVFPFSLLWQKFDLNEIISDLCSQLEEYQEKTSTHKLTLEGISADLVFEKYFENLPPFKDGEKKNEFPDAFAIAALEKWSEKIGQPIYVISGDKDWKAACDEKIPRLIYLEKLEELFQMIEFDDKLIAEYADKLFDQFIEEIEAMVEEQFISLGFFVDSSDFDRVIDDENVEDIDLLSMELVERYLVNVGEDTLSFSCNFNINFKAKIFYIDYTYAAYDKESGDYYFGESFTDEIHQNFITPVEVEIHFSREEPISGDLSSVSIQIDDVRIVLKSEYWDLYDFLT